MGLPATAILGWLGSAAAGISPGNVLGSTPRGASCTGAGRASAAVPAAMAPDDTSALGAAGAITVVTSGAGSGRLNQNSAAAASASAGNAIATVSARWLGGACLVAFVLGALSRGWLLAAAW